MDGVTHVSSSFLESLQSCPLRPGIGAIALDGCCSPELMDAVRGEGMGKLPVFQKALDYAWDKEDRLRRGVPLRGPPTTGESITRIAHGGGTEVGA